jgi:hypothetical protein
LITRSRSEVIIWEVHSWKQIILIDEFCAVITSSHRICKAFLHDGLYKPWNSKIISEFSDIAVEDIEDHAHNKNYVSISGQFNYLCPSIFKEMHSKRKTDKASFIPALKSNLIQPHKVNLLHYFSFFNNPECL